MGIITEEGKVRSFNINRDLHPLLDRAFANLKSQGLLC